MRFTIQVTALLSALATTSFAANTFSHFCSGGCRSAQKNGFDVTNSECFSLPKGANHVYFTQASAESQAEGTLCLYGFNEGGCRSLDKSDGTQEFHDVGLRGLGMTTLDKTLHNATSFIWSEGACVPPQEPSK
ncbi:hypothetical protein BDU57DRAFT_523737 [Ampelomyces quisqualis]|uniref:Uncharacterized protein n=1 Tax=Ampelomyces quisqualis TaxID=50730 RepID=A0A6A5Q8S3_AMPQU|nr:hypothetical protein BDU57DRAFT_523737 [Ampelomyces quisqualis]